MFFDFLLSWFVVREHSEPLMGEWRTKQTKLEQKLSGGSNPSRPRNSHILFKMLSVIDLCVLLWFVRIATVLKGRLELALVRFQGAHKMKEKMLEMALQRYMQERNGETVSTDDFRAGYSAAYDSMVSLMSKLIEFATPEQIKNIGHN